MWWHITEWHASGNKWSVYLLDRRVRRVGRGTRGVNTGEVSVRSGGVRAHTVPRTTDALRQTAAATAVTTHHLCTSHWTAVLCTPRRQDTHWDTDQRHAAQRRLIQLALHVRAVAEQAWSALSRARLCLKICMLSIAVRSLNLRL